MEKTLRQVLNSDERKDAMAVYQALSTFEKFCFRNEYIPLEIVKVNVEGKGWMTTENYWRNEVGMMMGWEKEVDNETLNVYAIGKGLHSISFKMVEKKTGVIHNEVDFVISELPKLPEGYISRF